MPFFKLYAACFVRSVRTTMKRNCWRTGLLPLLEDIEPKKLKRKRDQISSHERMNEWKHPRNIIWTASKSLNRLASAGCSTLFGVISTWGDANLLYCKHYFLLSFFFLGILIHLHYNYFIRQFMVYVLSAALLRSGQLNIFTAHLLPHHGKVMKRCHDYLGNRWAEHRAKAVPKGTRGRGRGKT